jgi:hypothetical protein
MESKNHDHFNRKNEPVRFVASLLFLLATTISTAYAQYWIDRARDRADDRYEDRQEILDRVEDRYYEERDRLDDELDRYDENNEVPAEKTVESESQLDEKCTVQQVLKLKDAGLSDSQILEACE